MRLRMKTAADVRVSMQRIANMTLDGEIEPKVANAVIYAANSVLQAIRTDEQQRRIDELETMLNELDGADK